MTELYKKIASEKKKQKRRTRNKIAKESRRKNRGK